MKLFKILQVHQYKIFVPQLNKHMHYFIEVLMHHNRFYYLIENSISHFYHNFSKLQDYHIQKLFLRSHDKLHDPK